MLPRQEESRLGFRLASFACHCHDLMYSFHVAILWRANPVPCKPSKRRSRALFVASPRPWLPKCTSHSCRTEYCIISSWCLARCTTRLQCITRTIETSCYTRFLHVCIKFVSYCRERRFDERSRTSTTPQEANPRRYLDRAARLL